MVVIFAGKAKNNLSTTFHKLKNYEKNLLSFQHIHDLKILLKIIQRNSN